MRFTWTWKNRDVARWLSSGPLALVLSAAALADVSIEGHVFDTDGRPLSQAQVTVQRSADVPGATAVTVFTDDSGRFEFPQPVAGVTNANLPLSVRALGFEPLHSTSDVSSDGDGTRLATFTVVMQPVANQASVAPASAWLARVDDPAERARMVMDCVGCHQHPSPEARAYAGIIEDVHGTDAAQVREQSWAMIVKYMNFLLVEEFGRGNPDAGPIDAARAYSSVDNASVASDMAKHFSGRMDFLQGYDYGAPLIVTPRTVISEYEVPPPNAVREAIMIGSDLWVADVNSDNVIRVDIATGAQKVFEVPSDVPVGPHTLVKGSDDKLWVAPLFNAVIAELDPVTEQWRTWRLQHESLQSIGIHDLTFGPEHEVMADARGRIWFSDIRNNAVGYFHPDTGEFDIFAVPEIPGRPGSQAALYGIAMTSDRQHIWYSQLGIGSFGAFNVETLEFETSVQLPLVDSGPRRLAISEDDVLYVPLYGSGQLVEYDTRARKQIGIYDLPDRASAPYSVTWDPVRQVAWVPTSNADAIYRFDPATKAIGVLPLPRLRAFLRMLVVDPATGQLVSSYANVHERVHGPRMAFIIDPGDGYTASPRLTMRGDSR